MCKGEGRSSAHGSERLGETRPIFAEEDLGGMLQVHRVQVLGGCRFSRGSACTKTRATRCNMGTSGAERSRWLSEVSRVSHGDAWGRAWAGPSAAVGRRGRALSCAQTCSGTSYEYTSNGLPAQSKRPLRLAGSAAHARSARTRTRWCARRKKRACERALTASDDMHPVDAAEKSRDGRVEARDKLKSPTR